MTPTKHGVKSRVDAAECDPAGCNHIAIRKIWSECLRPPDDPRRDYTEAEIDAECQKRQQCPNCETQPIGLV